MNSINRQKNEVREYIYFYPDSDQNLTIEPGMMTPQIWQLLTGFISASSGWQLLKTNQEPYDGIQKNIAYPTAPFLYILLDPKLKLVHLKSHPENLREHRGYPCDVHLLGPEGYIAINRGQSKSYLRDMSYYVHAIMIESQDQVLSIILTETPIIPL